MNDKNAADAAKSIKSVATQLEILTEHKKKILEKLDCAQTTHTQSESDKELLIKLKNDLILRDTQIANFTKELEKAKKEAGSTSNLGKMVTRLSADVDNYKNEIENYKKKLQKCITESAALKAPKPRQATPNIKPPTQDEDTAKLLASKNAEIINLTEAINVLKKRLHDCEEKSKQVSEAIVSPNQKEIIEDIKKDAAKVREENQAKLNNIQKALDNKNKECKQHLAEIERLKAELNGCKDKYEKLITELLRKMNDTATTLEQINGELDAKLKKCP